MKTLKEFCALAILVIKKDGKKDGEKEGFYTLKKREIEQFNIPTDIKTYLKSLNWCINCKTLVPKASVAVMMKSKRTKKIRRVVKLCKDCVTKGQEVDHKIINDMLEFTFQKDKKKRKLVME